MNGTPVPCFFPAALQSAKPLSHETGITLRDYFAAAALTGLLSYCGDITADDRMVAEPDHTLLAPRAFKIADALLAERIK